MKTIGMLGGMGPAATADLYLKVTSIFQKKYNASADADFPYWYIASVPIPDVVISNENEEKTLQMLQNSAQKLEQSGADILCIACNSVQYLNPKIQEILSIPVISIADAAVSYLRQHNFNSVAILSTRTTKSKGVYSKPLQNEHIAEICVSEKQQDVITECIMTELAGQTTIENYQKLMAIIGELKNSGAQAVLLACTELPVILQSTTDSTILDCTQVYAEAIVNNVNK